MPLCHASARVSSRLIPAGAILLASLSLSATPALAQHDAHDHAPAPTNTQQNQPPIAAAEEIKSDPYPLDTCPVTGKKLGAMGDPIVKVYDGREVRFCCGGCLKKFEADKAGYWKKIDEEIIKQQTPFYPLTTCPASGEALLGGDMGAPIDYVYNNRLVRFCCKDCVGKFLKDPAPTLAKLDEAVIKQQSAHYPIKTCMISGDALGGDMGEPIDRVYNNHLVRFCCKDCIKEFEKAPAKFLGMLDEAWKKQGAMPAAESSGGHDADHTGDHDGGAPRDHK